MAPAAYANFDVLIDRSPAGYRARVIQSPAGEAAVDFALPFSQEELGDLLWRAGGDTRHLGAAEAAASTLLSQARKAVAAQGNRQEWATPVLFNRSDDNRLIDLPDSRIVRRGLRVAMTLEETP